VFAGDLPIVDKPLPRFLDDAAAPKLLRTARADSDPLARVIVELLARTGMWSSALRALTVDAVIQIGSAYWLRVPIGKLHNDRYIPLHPQLKALLALLGHKTLAMTMVYARIADKTVADEHFKSPRRSKPCTSALVNCLPRTKAPRCAASVPRCTAACSAMGTAPARSK
jgi:integrase